MPTVSTVLHYAAPLTPDAPDDDWCIDALTRPPEVVLNFRTVPHHTTVTDLRDSAERPTLDTAGFERVTAPTSAGQRALAHNRAPALERYRQETAELLTSVTGADAVEFFDATLRRQDAAPPAPPPTRRRTSASTSTRARAAPGHAPPCTARDAASAGSRSSTSGGPCWSPSATTHSPCATSDHWT